MTIKSDRWIRQQARTARLIEPYSDELVSAAEGGGRVISYGVSSYGYDLRLAPEYKVFSPVHSVLVDPKKFDERVFEKLEGDHCIIPPHGFVLARSVEYIRMPSDCIALVAAKSSYARCFSGDTRVALVDGTNPTFEELAQRGATGEMFWGYALGPHGRIVVALLEAPRCVGRDALVAITLDHGQTIRVTPDHEFLLRDGMTCAAGNLRPGVSLMPLYRGLYRGYEMVYQPLTGFLWPTHRLADEWNTRHGIYADVPGTHRHHKDHNRWNNAPWNIERMDAAAHLRMHNAAYYGDGFDPDCHSETIRAALARLGEDPTWYAAYAAAQRTRALQFWSDAKYSAARERLLAAHKASWTPARREEQRQAMAARYVSADMRTQHGIKMKEAWAQDPARRLRQADVLRAIRTRTDVTADRVRWALDTAGTQAGAGRLLNCDPCVFQRFPEVVQAFRGRAGGGKNHKVVSITSVPGDHDVYCVTVPEAGNFALADGVFVKNCGIVVNFTVIEPSWEGELTLELSNTTPLPAKIYAHEGIAQLLFFQSDERCLRSYADRGGKYQGQRGVVPPRMKAE